VCTRAYLVEAVLHHGGLEDLILRVLPHAALDHDPHGARTAALDTRVPSIVELRMAAARS